VGGRDKPKDVHDLRYGLGEYPDAMRIITADWVPGQEAIHVGKPRSLGFSPSRPNSIAVDGRLD